MSNPTMVVRRVREAQPGVAVLDSDNPDHWRYAGRSCLVWCPGCDGLHRFTIAGDDGTVPSGPTWEWDGNIEQPTFNPSLLVHSAGDLPRCHSFLREGQWQFLSDCDHYLAGQTVPLPPLPEWLTRR